MDTAFRRRKKDFTGRNYYWYCRPNGFDKRWSFPSFCHTPVINHVCPMYHGPTTRDPSSVELGVGFSIFLPSGHHHHPVRRRNIQEGIGFNFQLGVLIRSEHKYTLPRKLVVPGTSTSATFWKYKVGGVKVNGNNATPGRSGLSSLESTEAGRLLLSSLESTVKQQ